MDGHVARTGDRRGVYRVLVGKPEGKRPLGRPRSRWKDNFKMDSLHFYFTNTCTCESHNISVNILKS